MAGLDLTPITKTLLALDTLGDAATMKGALWKEAHLLRRYMVRSFNQQSGGGIKPWAPLSPFTVMMRRMKKKRGRKALVVTGQLRNSIAVIKEGNEIFIGIPSGVSRSSESGGGSILSLALIHEYGVIQRMTKKQSQWFAIQISKAQKGKRKGKKKSRGAKRGPRTTINLLIIPPRPFIGPSTEVWSKGLEVRMQKHVLETGLGLKG